MRRVKQSFMIESIEVKEFPRTVRLYVNGQLKHSEKKKQNPGFAFTACKARAFEFMWLHRHFHHTIAYTIDYQLIQKERQPPWHTERLL